MLYINSFQRILSQPIPDTYYSSNNFTDLLEDIINKHSDIEYDISKSLQIYKGNIESDEEIKLINDILENFYMSRIGIRFLIGQHVYLQRYNNDMLPNTCVGIIDKECSPNQIIKQSVVDTIKMIKSVYGKNITINTNLIDTKHFMYIPGHLHYILVEILKNSAKATLDFAKNKEPITISTSMGKTDFIIKISDKGGGFNRLDDIFSFLYTSATTYDKNDMYKIAGYGHGVGLSRLYARYFDGDIKICPVENVGTDTYIYINCIGNTLENVCDKLL